MLIDCPICQCPAQVLRQLRTTEPILPQYDTAHRYHWHNGNITTRTMVCVNEHITTISTGTRCWCGWGTALFLVTHHDKLLISADSNCL